MKVQHLPVVACVLLLGSCHWADDRAELIAEIGDKKLTWKEVSDVVPDNSTAADSASLADHYIHDWITKQLIISKAEASLPEELMSFEEMIENYRSSLLIYAFEQEWVRQKLDTLVSEQEIEQYYIENEKNFQLKDYILKVKFTAIAADSKQLNVLKKLFNSSKPEDLVKWQSLCVDLGADYYFNEEEWLKWDEFIRQIPLEVYDVEGFLKKKNTIEFEKENNLYLISITDYQLAGSKSPLSFEREKIRAMIINKRKLSLLETMRQDIYAKAQQDGEIKLYYTKQ
jgi:nicotinic acid mononucleotide adenylyltransferase